MSRTLRIALQYLSLVAAFVPLIAFFVVMTRAPKPWSPVVVLSGCSLMVLACVMFVVNVIVTVIVSRITWHGEIAGSKIRIRNTIFHEQLVVDEQLVTEHRGFAFAVDLRGTAMIGGQPASVAAKIGGIFAANCHCYVNGAEVALTETSP